MVHRGERATTCTYLTVADIEWGRQKPRQLVLLALVVQRQIEVLLKMKILLQCEMDVMTTDLNWLG